MLLLNWLEWQMKKGEIYMAIKKGFLITLEGGEGGGKTTQAVSLYKRLKKAGKDVVIFREPGCTVISEQIREVVLSAKNKNIAFTTEVLLFQAARAQIYEELVLPSMRAGKVIVMDRSRDSSVVYQGMVRGFGKKMIEQLNNISTSRTLPDLTLLLDVPVNKGLKRRENSGTINRLDMEAKNFHNKVRKAYLELAEEDKSGRWRVINAAKSIENVEEQMWEAISDKLGL
ncbi:MAG: dTMP kinase [Candidatus Pacebacteria bacterium CG_4_10_14_3_um_filter_34_15]|nr:MAG: dTMP kinase [Candidatus Pacebacteria bacterium CG11_big_fil_rev_8_21_14_0_20_34_55]PIX81397.1 MAG: dTMP kinase [Candidatus Pacebacteria bacterium CG_4_10_14_3_um_filter_34_15]PJC43874.1 MAG: dTMP kinase [Candidatus Pacebacteria bacterium CG_4_9_14_0_2_um_filter_34_50]